MKSNFKMIQLSVISAPHESCNKLLEHEYIFFEAYPDPMNVLKMLSK